MKRMRSLVLVMAVAALMVAVFAPMAAANSRTGVTMKLTGPSSANNGSMIPLKVTIKNSLKYGGGNRVTVILQNKNGDLRRIASKAVVWSEGGSLGVVTVWVKARASAMGIAKYRAAWRNPGGTTYSNVKRVSID